MEPLILGLLFACSFAAAAVLYQEDVQSAQPALNIPTNAETLVCSSFVVTVPSPTAKVVVRAWLELTIGTGTTAVTLAIYRGAAVAGSPVYTKTPEAGDFTAGNTAHFELECIDQVSAVGTVQYTLSVTQTGASGNGTVAEYLLDTKVLSG